MGANALGRWAPSGRGRLPVCRSHPRVGDVLRLAGEIRGLTAQPTGLASGLGTELPSQSGPGHDPRRRATSPGRGPVRWISACSSARLVPVRRSRDGTLVPMQVTGTCRIAHADHVRRPCGSRTADRTSGDRRAIGLCHPPVAHDRLCGPPFLSVPCRALAVRPQRVRTVGKVTVNADGSWVSLQSLRMAA
jgi:hypothetical protein